MGAIGRPRTPWPLPVCRGRDGQGFFITKNLLIHPRYHVRSVRLTQVGIPFHHFICLVTKDTGDLGQGRIVHGEIAGRRMTEIVEPEILDTGDRQAVVPGFLDL